MRNIYRRLMNWLFGDWFRLSTSDNRTLEVRRSWGGTLWITVRDDCYEIALQVSAEDADKIYGWLRESSPSVQGKRNGLRMVKQIPVRDSKGNSGRGPGSPI